jgi:replicative DNA helicase
MSTMDIQTPRVSPHDEGAEQSILGAIMLDSKILAIVNEMLSEKDFYKTAHRRIFAAIVHLDGRNEVIDQITLTEQLRHDGHLESIGGAAYLAELWQLLPSATNVESHCRIVHEKAQRRQTGLLGHDLFMKAYDDHELLPDLIETAEQALFSIGHGTSSHGETTLRELVKERMEHLDRLHTRKATVTGIPTGFKTLDELTAGLQPGNLIVVGARPSMGKTSLALNMALHVAIHEKQPVQVFSLEMSKEELTDRLLTATASVDAHALKTGRVDSGDWWRLAHASAQLEQAPLFVDDSGHLTVSLLRSRARRRKAKNGLALIVVDYLQLMALGHRVESRQQEMAEISRSLKLLAKELKVPILALSQLNRSVESRPDKRPTMADLRESGAIEQDADLVICIYRDDVYNSDSADRGLAEILIRKHRNGPIGERKLVFIERFARFEDVAHVQGEA